MRPHCLNRPPAPSASRLLVALAVLLVGVPLLAQVFLPARRIVPVPVAGTIPPPLDIVTNAPWSAYSVARKLWSGWTGGAYVVQRDLDGASSIIGFTASGAVDTNSLMAFLGTTNGYTQAVYDQSGNGRHLNVYGNITNTLLVASNGIVIVDENNRPAGWHRDTTTFSHISGPSPGTSSNTAFTVISPLALSGADPDSLVNAASHGQCGINLNLGGQVTVLNDPLGTPVIGSYVTYGRQYLFTGLSRTSNVEVLQVNFNTDETYSGEAGELTSASLSIGENGADTSAGQWFSELIWYGTQADTNSWSSLSQNMIDYYEVDQGPWGFFPTAAVFDGANDYMRLTSGGPTGLSDGKAFTVSCWLNFSGGDGTQLYIYNNGDNINGFFYLYKTPGNKIALFARNAATATILDIIGSTSVTAASGWVHIFACVDLTDTAKRKIYINSAAESLTVNTYVDDTIDFVGVGYRYTVGSDSASPVTVFLPASVSELWWNDSYLDNPSAFASGGSPVSLNFDGSTPTGSAPVFYCRGNGNFFAWNAGTGGNFTVTGSLGTTTPP